MRPQEYSASETPVSAVKSHRVEPTAAACEWISLEHLALGSERVGGMVVRSAQVRKVLKTISRLSPYKATVLINGESGTGKELVARALHTLGPVPGGPFVTFNCSNLVESLAESQLFGHVHERVQLWLDPWAHYGEGTDDRGRQVIESLFGMAWGGLTGRGFGHGSPYRISYAESDFIMGAIGEELGLTAVMAVIVCYGLIVERGLRTALICRDGFGKLVATGLACVFALQVFVVIGGVTRLIPLTGLTTPFLSYGGSSLVANWVIVALLLRISDQARRPLPDLSWPDDGGDDTQIVRLA